MDVITIDHVNKYYKGGRIKAIHDVSITLNEGTVYGLIGPNGAGKTTLVKSILGAIKPTSGTIHVFDEKAGSVKANDQIGYVCEKIALPLKEDPYEYLLTMAILSKISIDVAAPKIKEFLHKFGLGPVMYQKMKSFSSGMKKKVQIIAALLSDPTILILDEPTANIDPKVRFEIFNFIKELSRSRNVTIFLCSHNLFELEKIVDDIIMINKGKKVIQGGYQDILKSMDNTNQLMIKTENDQKLIELIKKLPSCQITKQSPLTLHANDLNDLKLKVVEYCYKYNILINELMEIKDTLFDLFNHYNNQNQ